jgi:polysaccharide biosynthesis protein PslH
MNVSTRTDAAALVLCPEAPYPTTGGGSLRTASLIEYLARRTAAVDVIVFREPGAADPAAAFPAGPARSVQVIALPRHSGHALARAERNLRRVLRGAPPLIDRFAGFGPEVGAAIGGRRYGLAVIEHFWAVMYRDVLASAATRVALDLHNVESAWHASMAGIESAPKAAMLRCFARACERMERSLLPRFDALLATSEADAARVRRLAPHARVAVYPNAIPETPLPSGASSSAPALIFSGNLEYRPNQHGLRFFLSKVWPELHARLPEWEFRVAGKNGHAVRRLLADRPGVGHYEIGADPVGTLAQAAIAVVPLFAASGTRLKIIEAWAAGIPVVSTPLGAEGLPARDGVNIVIATDGRAFTSAIVRLAADSALRQRVGAAGRATFERSFTWTEAWRALDAAGLLTLGA